MNIAQVLVDVVLSRREAGDTVEHVAVTTETLQCVAAELRLRVEGLATFLVLDDQLAVPFSVVSTKTRQVKAALLS